MGDSFLITPGTGSGYLTILAKTGIQQEKMQPIDGILRGLIPRHRSVRSAPIPDGAFWIWGRRGEGILDRPTSWWKRWTRRGDWKQWIFWVARSGEGMFLALYLPKAERDPEEESLVRLVLGTLKPLPAPLKTPREFLVKVLELLKTRYPNEAIRGEANSDLTVLVGKTQINLEQAWKEYRQSPERFEQIAVARMKAVLNPASGQTTIPDLGWEANRSRIMPMLLSRDEFQKWQPGLVGTDWIAGLKIAYVLDEPDSYRYISLPLFNRWGISTDELHDQSLRNLEGYFQSRPMEIAASRNQETTRVLLPVRADAYNTSRLLSRSFQMILREYLGMEYAVGIPSRDLFVAIRIDGSELVSDVRQKILDDFLIREFPLSEKLLLISLDGVSEYSETDQAGD